MHEDGISAGIVLAGGGCCAVAQVGWLEELLPALAKRRIRVSYIGGSSAGALNGIKLAESHTDSELLSNLSVVKDRWLSLIENAGPEIIFPQVNYLTILFRSHGKRSLTNSDALWKLVCGGKFYIGKEAVITRGVDIEKVVCSPIRFDAFVNHCRTGRKVVFSNKTEPVRSRHEILPRATVASASLPPFFAPVEILGERYNDGGSITLRPAIEHGCSIIFVFLPYLEEGDENPPDNWFMKNYPWVYELFRYQSARVRELDREEIQRASEIAHDVKTYETQEKMMLSLLWFKRTKDKIARHFREAVYSFCGKRIVRIVPLSIRRKPSTLLVYDFGEGDLRRLYEDCRIQMHTLVEELDL